jgi:hypothetical protein
MEVRPSRRRADHELVEKTPSSALNPIKLNTSVVVQLEVANSVAPTARARHIRFSVYLSMFIHLLSLLAMSFSNRTDECDHRIA